MAHTSAPRTGAAVCRRDRMFKNERKSLAMPVAVLAAIIMMCAACFAFVGMSEAVQFDDEDGTDGKTDDLPVNEVVIAPDYKYNYTITFADDLVEDVTLSTLVDEFQSVGGYNVNITYTENPDHPVADEEAGTSVWGTMTLEVPAECTTGDYDVVIKAFHEPSNQYAWQYLHFTISQGVTIEPTTLNFSASIVNQPVSQEFTVSTGIGELLEVNVSGSGDGFTAAPTEAINANGQKTVTFTVTGTPSAIGQKTITISGANNMGEDFSYNFNFQVYSVFSGDLTGDMIGNADGATATSAIVSTEIPSDILGGLTYSVSVPEGYQSDIVDNGNGTISIAEGSTGKYLDIDVTITATHTDTQQSKTQTVQVHNEPAVDIQLDADGVDDSQYLKDGTFYTYVNAGARTLIYEPTLTAGNFSGIANWTVSGDAIVTNSDGTITITAGADSIASKAITITATTNFGIEMTETFNLVVEGALSVSGDNDNVRLINTEGKDTVQLQFTAEAANANLSHSEANSSDAELIDTLNWEGKSITFQSSTAGMQYTYTITVTTDGGQTDDISFTVFTNSKLTFNTPPTNGTAAEAA